MYLKRDAEDLDNQAHYNPNSFEGFGHINALVWTYTWSDRVEVKACFIVVSIPFTKPLHQKPGSPMVALPFWGKLALCCCILKVASLFHCPVVFTLQGHDQMEGTAHQLSSFAIELVNTTGGHSCTVSSCATVLLHALSSQPFFKWWYLMWILRYVNRKCKFRMFW